MFAFRPDMDRAFARGWPEARFVGAVTDVPHTIAGRRFVWTSEEAATHLRARFAASKMIQQPATFGPAEALAFARHVIPFGWNATWFDDLETDLFLLESLVGADVLAEAMTSALEEISPNEWKRADRNARLPFYLLGFVLLRCSDAPAIRARLEKMFERRRDEAGPLSAALDLVLHGAAGARRSAPGHGRGDADIDPRDVLFVDDDPGLIEAVVRAERFARWDRRFAARLAFLGGDRVLPPILDHWFSIGEATEQTFFLGTVGELASPLLAGAMREAANASLIRDDVARWLHERAIDLPPPPELPGALREETMTSFEVDEFGFVLLPEESARELRGDEDHAILTATLDATSLEPAAVDSHGRQAIVFCRTYNASFCETEDGLLLVYGAGPDEAREVFAAARDRRYVKLAEVTVESKLVGLPASLAFADARAGNRVIDLPLAPGRYVVRHAITEADDWAAILWFRAL